MLTWLSELPGAFHLFRYLTFRTLGAAGSGLVFGVLLRPGDHLRLAPEAGHGGQPIRADGPASHLLTKKGTPTMGGLMILFGLFVSALLWANLESPYVWIVLFVTAGFAVIGFYDDYLKVTKQSDRGFSGRAPPLRRICDRRARLLCADAGRRRGRDGARRAFRQRLRIRLRLGIPSFRTVRDCRVRQCGQPDRRPRRACDRAGDDRCRDARAHRLYRRQLCSTPTTF